MSANLPPESLAPDVFVGRLAELRTSSDFNTVLTSLGGALQTHSDSWWSSVLEELSKAPLAAQQAFSACMDFLCAEGDTSLGAHTRGWRCLGASVLLQRPPGPPPTRWSDTLELQESLAQALALDTSDVYVDAQVLPSEAAHDMTPRAMLRHCQLARSRAGGVTLKFLEGLAPATPAPKLLAGLRPVLFEAILTLAFRTSAPVTVTLLEKLQHFSKASQLFTVKAHGADMPLQMLEIAPPWTLASRSLHAGRAVRFGAIFRDTCRRYRLPPSQVQTVIARVEDPHYPGHVRCGLVGPHGNVLAGLMEAQLHRPGMYEAKVARILHALGAPAPVFQSHNTPLELLTLSPSTFLVPVSPTAWAPLEKGGTP